MFAQGNNAVMGDIKAAMAKVQRAPSDVGSDELSLLGSQSPERSWPNRRLSLDYSSALYLLQISIALDLVEFYVLRGDLILLNSVVLLYL